MAGGVLAELGNLYLNPLERRKQRWVVEVSRALNDIYQRYELLPEALQKDERFISFLFETTSIALKNHQQLKLDALRNALVECVDPASNEDTSFQFLRYVDELTPSHLQLLLVCYEHSSELARQKTMEGIHEDISKFFNMPFDRMMFRAYIGDLAARFLVGIEDIEELPEFASLKSNVLLEDSSTRPLEITPLGVAFLRFIQGN